MKKILTLLAIALAALTSCKEELVQYSISVDPVELSFNSAGGEDTVYVTSSAEWELFSDSGWCYFSSAGGDGDAEIVISVEPNEDSKSGRTATFTFVSGDKEATLTITQEKKEYSISIEPTELIFGAEGGEQEIVVTSSDEWEVTGESDWCYASVASGVNGDTVKFSVEPYMNTEEERTVIYTFVCGDKEAVLNIQQDAKVYSISVEPTELSFIAAGEEKTVTITSSDEWEFSSEESWISASEENGESGAVVNIIVEENDKTEIRTGAATFICGDKQADVIITQDAKEFSISIEPAEIEFEAEGVERAIAVTSSDEWTLTTDCDWIYASDTAGNNGASVEITAPFNNTSEQRMASIFFVCGNKTAELKLTQKANDFSISVEPAEVAFDAEGGKQTVEVTSSHEWTLINDTDWIITSVNEGESGSSVEISVDYNTSEENKAGEITFACGDKTAVLKVTQEYDGSPVIQFKDPYFLAAIIEQADINGDGQITEKEAASIKVLSTETNGNPSRNIDELKYFINIEELTIASIDIPSLSIDLNVFKNLCNFTIIERETSYNKEIKVSSLHAKNHEKLSNVNIFKASFSSDIDLSGCVNLTDVSIEYISANTITLNNCTALSNFKIGGDRGTIKQLNLCNCNALTNFSSLGYTSGWQTSTFRIDDINLSNCTNLTEVSISTYTNRLNCTGCSSMERLVCSGSHIDISTLILDGCYSLEWLDCSSNENITSLDLSDCISLKYLKFGYTGISDIDLSNNPAITTLICSHTLLTSLDVSNLKKLTSLNCGFNKLTTLNIAHNTELVDLTCRNNQLSTLDLTHNLALEELSCETNQLSVLDLSKNLRLKRIGVLYNSLNELILYKYHTINNDDIITIENYYGKDIIVYVE